MYDCNEGFVCFSMCDYNEGIVCLSVITLKEFCVCVIALKVFLLYPRGSCNIAIPNFSLLRTKNITEISKKNP